MYRSEDSICIELSILRIVPVLEISEYSLGSMTGVSGLSGPAHALVNKDS